MRVRLQMTAVAEHIVPWPTLATPLAGEGAVRNGGPLAGQPPPEATSRPRRLVGGVSPVCAVASDGKQGVVV